MTNETKHTPGPWKVDLMGEPQENRFPNVVIGKGYIIINHADTKEQARIDAHLIAAAPELLEIAKDVLYMLKECGYGGRNRSIEKLHEKRLAKAIAKAMAEQWGGL